MARGTVRIRPGPGAVAGGGGANPALAVANLVRHGILACRADDALGYWYAAMDRLAVLDAAGRIVGRDSEGNDAPLRRLVPAFYSSY